METIYDRLGLELYQKLIDSGSFNAEQLRLLSDGLRDTTRVLDLGIGLGNLAKILIEQGKVVYGIDNRQDSLDYAKRKVGPQGNGKLFLFEKDARYLDFYNQFDGVSCVSNFQEREYLNPVFSGVYRALQKNGYFAMTGLEGSQMERHKKFKKDEAERDALEGRLVLTPEEIKKLRKEDELNNEAELRKAAGNIDSSEILGSEITIAALKRNGFNVLRTDKFYHDTSYFILAQRD